MNGRHYLSAIVAVISLFAFRGIAHATTFYLSSSEGNDTLNSGLSEQQPWRTVTHMIEKMLDGVVQQNDIVLLKRGDTFRKEKCSDAPFHARMWVIPKTITLGAYGDPSLPRPVMSGGMPVINWEVHRDNIWVADAPDTLTMLYVDRKLMYFARYPNSGWLHRTDTENDDVFICDELRDHPRNADGYWAGATLRRRATPWHWGRGTVTGYNASTCEIVARHQVMETWGFYLDNKLEELDTVGEWYLDTANMKVYLYTADGTDPNAMDVVGAVFPKLALSLKGDGMRVQDLCFRYFPVDGVVLEARTEMTRCLFECMGSDQGSDGLLCRRESTGSSITHCMFRNMTCVAIDCHADTVPNVPQTLFEFDTLMNIMSVPAYGRQGSQNWSNIGFVLSKGRNIMVRHCYFNHIGYAGLGTFAEHDTIEYNIFDDCMCLLNDGAAIYTYCDSTVVRNNLVLNTRGCMFECGQGAKNLVYGAAHGIWSDSQRDFYGMVFVGNTVANASVTGIRLSNDFYFTIRDNVVYNSGVKSMAMMQSYATTLGSTRTGFMPTHHRIENNVFVTTEPDRPALKYLTSPAKDAEGDERIRQKTYDLDFGLFRGNYYCNPSTDTLIERGGLHPKLYDTRFTLAEWQSDLTCADQTSKTDPIKRPAGAAPGDLTGTTRLVINDQLTRRTIPLDNGVYLTKDADTVYGAVTLDPYTSIVLWHTGQTSTVPRQMRIAEFVAFRGSGGRLSLHTRLSKRATVRIRVYALSGRLVGERTYRLQAGAHRLPMVDEHGAAACGFYHCEAAITTESARRQVRANVMVMR
jgi:hypothetical protein